MEINPVKGTHDIVGVEADYYHEIETYCRNVALNFGYQEIRTPIIEHTPLFIRSVGEGSDIVSKEMYTFDDKGGRSITLRPELTAGVMRSIVSNKLYANADLPLRYFYCGPCFRYERPQAGRYRQFHQFGVEAVGAPSFTLDAEVITLGHRCLLSLGLGNVTIKINSLGDDESRARYKVALKEYFSKYIDNMCPDCKRRLEVNPLRILDCKVPEDIEIVKNAPKLSDYLSEENKAYLNTVRSLLEEIGIKTVIDESLVRGLDYYTGVVWEYHVTAHKEGDVNVGALGGGGHYAKLLGEVGGPSLEGVGMSLGVERLFATIEKSPNDAIFGPDFYIMAMCDEALHNNFVLLDMLRSHGFSAVAPYEQKSFKSAFKMAERMKAKFAIIIGEDELKKNEFTVKNLKSQQQTSVKVSDSINVFKDMLIEYNEEYFAQLKGDEENE